MFYDSFTSPVGEITLIADGDRLTGLHIAGDRYFGGVASDWDHSPQLPVLQQAKRELKEYFAGKRMKFEVPVSYTGTPFQHAVWNALQKIAPGKTISYSALAEKIGKPKAVRAVGSAIGRNPICIIVPCHRVLASDGSFGGYVAGVTCKQTLLGLEGVH